MWFQTGSSVEPGNLQEMKLLFPAGPQDLVNSDTWWEEERKREGK